MKSPSYTLLKDIDQHLGRPVTVKGWVANLRSSGKISFLQLRDGTGSIQAIALANQLDTGLYDQLKKLTLESSLELTGTPKSEPRSPSGYELLVDTARVLQLSQEDYPIGKKAHGVPFLLDHRHLWLRSPKERAIQVIRNHIIYALYEFYQAEGFTKIDTPILTPNACEGTTTLFEVDYFGEPSYLSQSGQLYLEAAIFSVGRCFDFAPVFRAEKSKTRRHLIEFWMTDAEAAFLEHEENLNLQERMVMHVLNRVLARAAGELAILERDTAPLSRVKPPFPRLTYHQAVKELNSLGSDIKAGEDLGNDDESILMNHYQQPVFIQFFPAAIKAFYMKRHPDEPQLALCADLLAPEGRGEIIGGSQREDDYATLLASIQAHGLPVADFQWYLDLRKYGSVPHSGFGLGLERLVGWLCGLTHVRRTIPFPRLLNRQRP